MAGGLAAASCSRPLKPQNQRGSSRDVIDRLRPKLSRITGVAAFLQPVQDMRVGGRGGNSTYQYTLKADDPATLQAAGPKLVAALKKEPMLTDVDIDQNDSGAEVYVDVDRDAATRLGIAAQTIDATLYDGFGQRQVATIYSGLNQYHVVMGVAPEFTGTPEALDNVYLPVSQPAIATGGSNAATTGTLDGPASAGTSSSTASVTGARDQATGSAVSTAGKPMTRLSTIARWSTQSTASEVNHQDGSPSATVSFSTADGVSLGQASQRITEIQNSIGLPASVHGSFSGTAKVFKQSTATMPILIVSALLVIYIVLGILYESAIHPLTVLSTLPSAGLGAVVALMVAKTAFDLIGLIALILLIGIVKKNAIMIIDFALDAERSRGLTPLAAIREASILRFRPILMTTLAAAFGALPLAIGFGEGAELRRPLGIAIIGGLIASQFITLLTTPVVYLALDRFRRRGPNETRLSRHGDDFQGLPA